ncbi:Rv1733c family protein [Streptomyces sp. bgisy027]|uniref:Rv1733c family protein n=1 Tax=unclassified Streptomyces TaxID=2593676 RepID=UPI003D7405E9
MSAQGSPSASGPSPPHQEHTSKGANPLRRTSDRVESWILTFLMCVFVVGMPAAALGAGLTAYESSMRAVQTQSAERHEVSATLTSDAKGSAEDAKRQAPVRWTDDNGAVRTGTTLVEPGTPKGATVQVWVDRDGTLTEPPMSTLNAQTTGWFVGGMAAAGVTAAFFAARTGVHHVLDRRRYAQWEAEWVLVEPLWSARYRR